MYWILFIATILSPGSYELEATRVESKPTCMELARAINAVGHRTAICEPRSDS